MPAIVQRDNEMHQTPLKNIDPPKALEDEALDEEQHRVEFSKLLPLTDVRNQNQRSFSWNPGTMRAEPPNHSSSHAQAHAMGSNKVLGALAAAHRLERQTASQRRIPDTEETTGEEDKREKTYEIDDSSKIEKKTWFSHVFRMIFCTRVSILLLFLPLGWSSHHLRWSGKAIFWLNFMGMIPLASILGDFTEELALHTNQVIGGLINATFGNAVEVVVAIQALQADEIRVVQASLLGSILSNLLLVLGCCFFFGGLKYTEQSFNSTAATANISLLALSSIALVLPTPFAEYYEVQDQDVLTISRVAAVFLIFMYLQLLLFQLKTHVDLFAEDDDEEPELPFWIPVVGLVIVTLLVSIFSEYLVESIDSYVKESGISRTFVGIVIMPVIGNAVEHIAAVSVAMKNKMDLSMGIAIGSSAQISLFVVPFSILVGWMMNKNMTLNFPHFEIILYVLSIVIVSICLANTRTNWLQGSLLITTYIMLCVGFWFENLVSYRRR